jgi:hypothetical protein
MIPASRVFDQTTLTQLLTHDPVVAAYRRLFSLFDWSLVEQWQAQHSSRGRPAHRESAYLKAFLVRINEGFSYTTQLRAFLLKHPLLVIALGFHLELDPTAAYGFDVERTLPCRFWFGQKLRQLDRARLARPPAGHCGRFTSRDPRLGRSRCFRCEAHLCLGQGK